MSLSRLALPSGQTWFIDLIKNFSFRSGNKHNGPREVSLRHLYRAFFAECATLKSYDMMLTSPLALTKKLEGLGIVKVASFSGVYKEKDLISYFDAIQKAWEKRGSDLQSIAIVLESAHHAIMIGRSSAESKWLLFEIHQAKVLHIKSSADMAKKVMATFLSKECVIFSTSLYGNKTTKKSLSAFVKKLQDQQGWNDIHRVEEEKAKLVDDNGGSWLHVAAKKGQLDVVKKLLATQCCHTNAVVTNGATALCAAVAHGHLETVQALLAGGASADVEYDNGMTPLYCAASSGYSLIVNELLAKDAIVNVSLRENGATPLSIAVEKGYLDIVQALLQKGAKANVSYGEGITPLYYAVYSGNRAIVKELLASLHGVTS